MVRLGIRAVRRTHLEPSNLVLRRACVDTVAESKQRSRSEGLLPRPAAGSLKPSKCPTYRLSIAPTTFRSAPRENKNTPDVWPSKSHPMLKRARGSVTFRGNGTGAENAVRSSRNTWGVKIGALLAPVRSMSTSICRHLDLRQRYRYVAHIATKSNSIALVGRKHVHLLIVC